MDILNMLYGEKHDNHVLQKMENFRSYGNSDSTIELFSTNTDIDVNHNENTNDISQSLELSFSCNNEIKTVHETDLESSSSTKQNSAVEKSCIMKNEPDEERNEEVLENVDNNGVEICNLESDVDPDYFWHSVRLFNMSFNTIYTIRLLAV